MSKNKDGMVDEVISYICNLTKELNEYRDEYYNHNKSSVSDKEYDLKFDELKGLEEKYELVLSNSPTQEVGYTVISKLKKVEHPIPLKSLDKTKDINELTKWQKDKEIIFMLKADGLTIELLYEGGNLVQASTRGDSKIGEDTTHNAKTFKNIPLKISFKGTLRIAGEAIIHKDDFEKINSKLSEDEKYKTPRNLVAGSVRQLDSSVCAERYVCFYTFNILECSEKLENTKSGNFIWLEGLGFEVIDYVWMNCNITNSEIDWLKEIAQNKNIPIDGLVASFDDIKYSNSLGETSHHPLHSLAFKMEDETADTILTSIEWSVGRTGVITPVAIFGTVLLDNTEVSRASLHNLSIMEELEIGILDMVSIHKANQIIPQIQENHTRSNNVEIPENCPECGGIAIIDQPGNSKILYCTNPNCTAKLLGRFEHFVSKAGMNIDGLSSATLEKFINVGFLKTFDDIYKLGKYENAITKMNGFGIKSYDKLIKAIDNSKKVKTNNFIYSLGIDNIGRTASKTIAEYFDYDYCKFKDATISGFDFSQLTDFGVTMYNNIHNWYDTISNLELSDNLIGILEFVEDKKVEVVSNDNPFNGKKVYATGSFANYKKAEIKELLESLGAEFSSGYAKSLDMLLVGSLKGSSKVGKAEKDGIPVITEDEFLKMI